MGNFTFDDKNTCRIYKIYKSEPCENGGKKECDVEYMANLEDAILKLCNTTFLNKLLINESVQCVVRNNLDKNRIYFSDCEDGRIVEYYIETICLPADIIKYLFNKLCEYSNIDKLNPIDSIALTGPIVTTDTDRSFNITPVKDCINASEKQPPETLRILLFNDTFSRIPYDKVDEYEKSLQDAVTMYGSGIKDCIVSNHETLTKSDLELLSKNMTRIGDGCNTNILVFSLADFSIHSFSSTDPSKGVLVL